MNIVIHTHTVSVLFLNLYIKPIYKPVQIKFCKIRFHC